MRGETLGAVALAVAVIACAPRAARVCAPLASWASPATVCRAAAPPVAASASPPPAPAPLPPPQAEMSGDRVNLSGVVLFETGSAVLLVESEEILRDAARVIKAHPEIARVRVEGHTDSRDTRARNLRLSR